ncbi:MAG: hypothetical protein B7Z40_22195 [Bosea sp. 12-68-7]|nr:MAG: hypothetical protein B7Z40_22195 [Bosea sp. 12-68-7]
MLKRAYDGLVAYSSHPAAPWLLFFLTFIESSVSPLPPIPLLIPMCIARPDRAWFYAGVCSLGAVLGGYLGYAIGALLSGLAGGPLLTDFAVTVMPQTGSFSPVVEADLDSAVLP